MEVDAENQVAVRSLDRLYLQTERWAELASILERESEIGQTPDEILEYKYPPRSGAAAPALEPRCGDRGLPRRPHAAPEHKATLEALEGLFAAPEKTKQVEIAETLEPLYRAAGEWESSRASTKRSSRTFRPSSRKSARAAYYKIAESSKTSSSIPCRPSRSTSAR